MAAQANLDTVGYIYISLTIAWTIILSYGMAILFYNRSLPFLRLRRLPLVFVAIGLLHIYWILCMIGYVIGPLAPCAVEYWIMSLLLPAGIATFQVANSQFCYIATQQRKFANLTKLDHAMLPRLQSSPGVTSLMARRFKPANHITKLTTYVIAALLVEFCLTILIFLISRKFHPSFGPIPVDLSGTVAEQRVRCSRGWEWWLSIVWQIFWVWIYAPYILWRSRSIRDTHGWRTQTILCCLVGLPASPLWLTALYVEKMATVNQYFIPPQWFSVSIFFIETFSVFLPLREVFASRNLQGQTIQAIKDWEVRMQLASSTGTLETSRSITSSKSSLRRAFILGKANTISRKESHASLYSLTALKDTLECNPQPLQEFAALKDFSGENISFLTHIAKWKANWKESGCQVGSSIPKECRMDINRQQFNFGLQIFASLISPDLAEFPINICSMDRRRLEKIFAPAATICFGSRESVDSSRSTPFANLTEVPEKKSFDESSINSTIWYWGAIPSAFGPSIFDEIERSVTYLVITSVWPNFLKHYFKHHDEERC